MRYAVLLILALAGCSEKLDNPPTPYVKCIQERHYTCGRFSCTECLKRQVECIEPLVLDSNDKGELFCRLKKDKDDAGRSLSGISSDH